MPYAQVLTTASKANLTGGAFADTLVANSGDSLAVANYDSGGARILELWGMDDASVMEGQLIYTRPESTHDQQHGYRFECASLLPGGAGKQAAQDFLPGYGYIDVFKSDAALIQVTGTAADNVMLSYLIEYDDLPGASAQFMSWEQCKALHKSTVGINCIPVASATKGAYGATRAINADDDRLHANTYYAILGWSVQTFCHTVSMLGPGWGGQRIGGPAGLVEQNHPWWFVEQSIKWGKPLIPFFNAADKGNVLLQIADLAANLSPKIDVNLFELSGTPGS
jgi:hypothetical protein